MNSVRILTVNPSDPKGTLFARKWLGEIMSHKPTNWSVASNLADWQEIRRGDSFLFLLQGRKKGIIGFGEILSKAGEGRYYSTGEPGLFVKVRFAGIINPFAEPNLILSREHLLQLGLTEFEFVRQSGRSIDAKIGEAVRNLFVSQVSLARLVANREAKLAA